MNVSKSKEYLREYYLKNKDKYKKYAETYRDKNPEKIKQIQHANYLKNKLKINERHRKNNKINYELNREKELIRNKEYREKNKEKLALYYKIKYQKNKSKIDAVSMEYKRNHPDMCKNSQQKRRALKNNSKFEKFKISEIFERDGYVCGICGYGVNKDLTGRHPFAASLDHIIPLNKGGTHTKDNVQCSHFKCNIQKHTKILPKIELIYGDPEFKW